MISIPNRRFLCEIGLNSKKNTPPKRRSNAHKSIPFLLQISFLLSSRAAAFTPISKGGYLLSLSISKHKYPCYRQDLGNRESNFSLWSQIPSFFLGRIKRHFEGELIWVDFFNTVTFLHYKLAVQAEMWKPRPPTESIRLEKNDF